MTRKKSKAKAAARADKKSPPPSNEITEPVYGQKKIFALFTHMVKPSSWVEINPHNSGDDNSEDWYAVNPMREINSPPTHMDVRKLTSCGMVVFNDKLYFIGGQFLDEFIHDDELFDTNDDIICYKIYSDKIFTYHLVSNEWEELPCKLNIARSHPIVLVVGNVIYVMGGMVDSATHHITNKEHWMECLNVLDVGKNQTFEFLPAASAPPDNVFGYVSAYHFAYEPRNEIVFVMAKALGGCSFNCVSKTWAPFHENISKHANFMGARVAVVDHLIFLFYEGVIYAYDLKNNQLVLSQCLPSSFGGANEPGNESEFYPLWLFLERVGKDTLVLIRCDSATDCDGVVGLELHLYKFQIKYDEELRLLPDGSGHYFPPGVILIDVVTG